ncbi:hypothetical protein ACHAC9_05295 [Massilia sp. CMS3.1]|uniref:hypothetical protein n=1 Tax=Massilia sp. CMS3.1 TaxID=3373083 RepID=UPI003EE70F46
MRHLLVVSLFSFAIASGTASAAPDGASSALSQASANLSGVVVGGSILTVAAAGSVLVASVRTVGDVLEIVLESAVDASRTTVRVSSAAAGGLSLATGTVLEVVAASTGYVLVMSGKAIAFLPNEAGKALLHHARAV